MDKDIFEAAGGADVTAQYLENAEVPVNINLKNGSVSISNWKETKITGIRTTKVTFAGYKFVFINDSSARAMSVQSGDADVALDCAVSDYSVYDADPNVQAVLNDNGMVKYDFLKQHWGQTV